MKSKLLLVFAVTSLVTLAAQAELLCREVSSLTPDPRQISPGLGLIVEPGNSSEEVKVELYRIDDSKNQQELLFAQTLPSNGIPPAREAKITVGREGEEFFLSKETRLKVAGCEECGVYYYYFGDLFLNLASVKGKHLMYCGFRIRAR